MAECWKRDCEGSIAGLRNNSGRLRLVQAELGRASSLGGNGPRDPLLAGLGLQAGGAWAVAWARGAAGAATGHRGPRPGLALRPPHCGSAGPAHLPAPNFVPAVDTHIRRWCAMMIWFGSHRKAVCNRHRMASPRSHTKQQAASSCGRGREGHGGRRRQRGLPGKPPAGKSRRPSSHPPRRGRAGSWRPGRPRKASAPLGSTSGRGLEVRRRLGGEAGGGRGRETAMVRGGEGVAASAIWLTRENVERGSRSEQRAGNADLFHCRAVGARGCACSVAARPPVTQFLS